MKWLDNIIFKYIMMRGKYSFQIRVSTNFLNFFFTKFRSVFFAEFRSVNFVMNGIFAKILSSGTLISRKTERNFREIFAENGKRNFRGNPNIQ